MRHSKTGLFLMELIIVIFFFALTSAISLQVFVKAHSYDVATENMLNSVIWADNASSIFYEYGSDPIAMAQALAPEGTYLINSKTIVFYLDKDYQPVEINSSKTHYTTSVYFKTEGKLETMSFMFKDVKKQRDIYNFKYEKHIKEVVSEREKEN